MRSEISPQALGVSSLSCPACPAYWESSSLSSAHWERIWEHPGRGGQGPQGRHGALAGGAIRRRVAASRSGEADLSVGAYRCTRTRRSTRTCHSAFRSARTCCSIHSYHCACAYRCTCACLHAYDCAHTYRNTCTCVHACCSAHTYRNTCACVHAYCCAHTCAYCCLHTCGTDAVQAGVVDLAAQRCGRRELHANREDVRS